MPRVITRLASTLAVAVALAALPGCGTTPTTTERSAGAPPVAVRESSTTPEAQTPAPVPPAPADASGMQEWLAKAYPGATWLTRIKKVEHVPGEVAGSGGFANAIVVTTDLSFDGEQPAANEITAALGESHISWARQFVVRFADGENIMAGDIVDPTP